MEVPENMVDEQLPDDEDDLLSLIGEKIQVTSFNEYLWPIVFKPEDVECKAYTIVNYNLSDIEFVLSEARRKYINSWRLAWEDRDVTSILLLSDMYKSYVEVKFGLTALMVNDTDKAVESYIYGCIVNYRLDNLEDYKQKVVSTIGIPNVSINFFEEVREKLSEKVEDEDILLSFKESSLNYIVLTGLEFDRISDVTSYPVCDIESTLERTRDFIESIAGDPYLKAIYYDLIYYVFRVILEDKYFLYNDMELVQRFLCYMLFSFEDVFGIKLYVTV